MDHTKDFEIVGEFHSLEEDSVVAESRSEAEEEDSAEY